MDEKVYDLLEKVYIELQETKKEMQDTKIELKAEIRSNSNHIIRLENYIKSINIKVNAVEGSKGKKS